MRLGLGVAHRGGAEVEIRAREAILSYAPVSTCLFSRKRGHLHVNRPVLRRLLQDLLAALHVAAVLCVVANRSARFNFREDDGTWGPGPSGGSSRCHMNFTFRNDDLSISQSMERTLYELLLLP
jgi:hypothetical protein